MNSTSPHTFTTFGGSPPLSIKELLIKLISGSGNQGEEIVARADAIRDTVLKILPWLDRGAVKPNFVLCNTLLL